MTEKKAAYVRSAGGDKGVSDNPTALIFAQPSGQVKRVFTTSEAAPILGVSRATVARWCERGKLRAFNVGGPHRPTYRIPEAEIRRVTEGEAHREPALDLEALADALAPKLVTRVVLELMRRMGGER